MANIKSSAKRDLKSKQQRADNRADMTELKTKIKKFDAAVAEGNKEAAAELMDTADPHGGFKVSEITTPYELNLAESRDLVKELRKYAEIPVSYNL